MNWSTLDSIGSLLFRNLISKGPLESFFKSRTVSVGTKGSLHKSDNGNQFRASAFP